MPLINDGEDMTFTQLVLYFDEEKKFLPVMHKVTICAFCCVTLNENILFKKCKVSVDPPSLATYRSHRTI